MDSIVFTHKCIFYATITVHANNIIYVFTHAIYRETCLYIYARLIPMTMTIFDRWFIRPDKSSHIFVSIPT